MLGEGCAIGVEHSRSVSTAAARDHERRFGQTVAGIERRLAEAAASECGGEIVEGPTVAIGGALPLARFASLAPYEVAYVREAGADEGVRRVLPGPSAVRAFLWWLTQERDAHRRQQRAVPVRRTQLPG